MYRELQYPIQKWFFMVFFMQVSSPSVMENCFTLHVALSFLHSPPGIRFVAFPFVCKVLGGSPIRLLLALGPKYRVMKHIENKVRRSQVSIIYKQATHMFISWGRKCPRDRRQQYILMKIQYSFLAERTCLTLYKYADPIIHMCVFSLQNDMEILKGLNVAPH